MHILIFLLASLVMAIPISYADSRLAAPAPHTVCSRSGAYCVEFAPGTDGIAFHNRRNGARQELWRIPGWQRVAFLSDDGRHLATCYGGMNLIPRDYSPELVMVSVFVEGKLRHQIRLKDLISRFDSLQETASHFHWGSCSGLSPDGKLLVRTVEKNDISINLETGEVRGK